MRSIISDMFQATETAKPDHQRGPFRQGKAEAIEAQALSGCHDNSDRKRVLNVNYHDGTSNRETTSNVVPSVPLENKSSGICHFIDAWLLRDNVRKTGKVFQKACSSKNWRKQPF